MEQHFTHVSAQLAEKDEQIAKLQGTIAEKQEKIEQVQSFLYSARLLHALKIVANQIDSKLAPMEFTTTFPNLFGIGTSTHSLIHLFLVHHFIHILLAASCQFVSISSVVLDELPSCTCFPVRENMTPYSCGP